LAVSITAPVDRSPLVSDSTLAMSNSLPRDDLDLLCRIRGGDEAAFGQLIDRYWAALVAYATRIGDSEDDAEDAVQTALIRVWQKRDTWRIDGSVRALVFRIVRDAMLDQSKATARRARRDGRQARQGTPSVPTPEEELARSDLQAALAAAVAGLSERRRAVYQLTRVDGLSYREAAEVLGISSQTAANHLSAALSELHSSLRDYLVDAADPAPQDVRRSRP
jgi:RNA polymerase sigma-70 factor (ECF subfamily)